MFDPRIYLYANQKIITKAASARTPLEPNFKPLNCKDDLSQQSPFGRSETVDCVAFARVPCSKFCEDM